MTKGAVIAAVGVGVVVILGAAAFASASTGKPYVPDLGPPPPPPPGAGSLGRYLVQEGGRALDELGKSDVVKTYTGGEKGGSYIVKNLATGGIYGTAKGIKNVGKKIISSIF